MAAESLSCQELVELVTDYLENHLSEHDRALFEAHIAVCPGCSTYVDQMRQTIRAVGSLAAEPPADESLDDLVALFRGWRDR
jgi:anti-sigma factor RsiW